MRQAAIALGALALFAASCSAQDAIGIPGCEGDGPQVIVAQSVPTASQIPCLDGLPDGWSLDEGDVSESGSRFSFDSDRAGDEAAVLTLRADCDVSGAVFIRTTDDDSIDRYEEVIALDPSFESVRSHVFEGGCVQWTFDFDRDVSATLTVELDDRLSFVRRVDFEQVLRDDFLDVDL